MVSSDAFQNPDAREEVNANRTPMLMMQASVVEVFYNHNYLFVLATRVLYVYLTKGPFYVGAVIGEGYRGVYFLRRLLAKGHLK